jgi:cytochrome c
MKAKGGRWTYDELFKFIKSPGAYIPGTKMTFAGLHSAEDRINLIAFLRTNTDHPEAIPAPMPVKPVKASAGTPTAQSPASVQMGKTTSGPTVKNPPATPGK